jgi:arylsulfatase A-like enzyme
VRVWRTICLAVVAATVLWTMVGARGRVDVRPNVLLVSIDSLRADHLGSYGYARDTSPTIDRLAREGVLFETAISSAPWTIPAHATMLTGLPPEVHGVNSWLHRLGPEAYSVAEVMQGAGYDTAAFVSGPTVMAQYGFDQGFALFDESMAEPDRKRSARGTTSPGLVALVDGFLERWSGSGRVAPFFVFLHMWDVHYDYAPPAPYDRMFDPDYRGDVTADDFERNRRINARMARRDLEHVIALYDGEIRFTDDHLGRIVARLRGLGVLDDTIVVVTSDHGDEFFEHGWKGHAKTLFDEVIHVPLVIRYPRRIASGQRVAAQVRLMDIAPTILGLARVGAPDGFGAPHMDDRHRFADLTPYVAGEAAQRGVPALPAFSANSAWSGLQQAVRTADAKLIRQEPPKKAKKAKKAKMATPTLALFDLRTDPGERTNLIRSPEASAIADALGETLAAFRDETGRQTRLAEAHRPTPKHEARLRALGYVQ